MLSAELRPSWGLSAEGALMNEREGSNQREEGEGFAILMMIHLNILRNHDILR